MTNHLDPSTKLGKIAVEEMESICATIEDEIVTEVAACTDQFTARNLIQEHHHQKAILEEGMQIIKKYTT
jgi:hypothetical protein